MHIISTAHATSTAAPERFFDRWADMASWPEWNADTEWARLDGPFAEGSTGRLKPKGAPAVRFVIRRLLPGEEFVDVSHLLGARLTFDHRISVAADGRSALDVTVSIEGPLRVLWTAVLGRGLRGALQPDLDRLVALAEGR